MARDVGATVEIRSRNSQALGAAMAVAGVVGVVVAATEGPDVLLRYVAPLLLFGVLGWAAFWQPRVVVSDGGVQVVNTWRTTEVPWPAVDEVEGRYGLRLRTAYGAITAWGAPAPAGRRRRRTDTSEAAATVVARLEELREAGYLEHRTLERPRPDVHWHRGLLAVAGVLVVATVVLPLVG